VARNQSVGGIWDGQVTDLSGASAASLTIVAEDGRYFTITKINNACEIIDVGTMTANGSTITANNTVSLEYPATALSGQTCGLSDGSSWTTSGTLSGTVVQRSSITLMARASDGTALPSTEVQLTFDNRYDQPSSLAAIAGNWTFSNGIILSINADGVEFFQDPVSGCVLNGQVSIINANYNIYSESFTYSNCTGTAATLNGPTMSGLMALDNAASPHLLYLGPATSASGTINAVLGELTR
jgi:hypothetical protein